MKVELKNQLALLNGILMGSTDDVTIDLDLSSGILDCDFIIAQIDAVIMNDLGVRAHKSDDKWLYAFEIVNPSPRYLAHIGREYEKAASVKLHDRTYSKLEKDYAWRLGTSFLYVGKVDRCSLSHRLKQHFGFGRKNIGALNLNYWVASVHPQLKLKLHLIYLLPRSTVYQVIEMEALLANAVNPLIGQR